MKILLQVIYHIRFEKHYMFLHFLWLLPAIPHMYFIWQGKDTHWPIFLKLHYISQYTDLFLRTVFSYHTMTRQGQVLTYFWGWGWDVGGDLWWAGSSWSFRSRWRCPSGPPECCPVLRGTPLPGTRTTPLPSDPSVAPVLEKKSKMCLWKKRELPVKCDHSIIHVHVILLTWITEDVNAFLYT